jgi:hypothetical protein
MVNGKMRIEHLRVDLITHYQEYIILEIKSCQGTCKNLGSASLILDMLSTLIFSAGAKGKSFFKSVTSMGYEGIMA